MTPHNLRRRARPATPSSIRATVVSVARREIPESRQLEAVDEFTGFVQSANGCLLLPTPYNVMRLLELCEISNMLPQCVEAYVTNIVLTGWEVDDRYRDRKASEDETFELQSFIDHPNVDGSLVAIMAEVIRDRERVGFGFIEVVRDAVGRPAILRHAPSRYTRLTTKYEVPVAVSYDITRGRRVSTVQELKKFRRFVQIIGGRYRWFKEFGDPRKMNATTGLFQGQVGYVFGDDASELIHIRLPSKEAYGVPRWVNQVPSILGSREAEEVNMRYFQDNTVPPMLLLVGNGRLTAASYQQLTAQLNDNGVGSARQNRIMLLEAVGESDSLDGKSGAIELKVERLTDARQSDGLFRDYDDANMAKIRSSFRLPPVLVGMSQDVNFATAGTSVFVAESQVFAPERSVLDDLLNTCLVSGPRGLGIRTAKLTSRTPSITAPEMVVKTLTALNVMGALTPRSAQRVANQMLQLEVGTFPEKGEDGYEEWMDKPIAMELRSSSSPSSSSSAAAPTDNEQSQKTPDIKELEESGDVALDVPKNGAQ